MPRRDHLLPESRAKVEEGGWSPASRPLDKFKDLARKLVNVSREELRREQEKYGADNAVRRSQRRGRV